MDSAMYYGHLKDTSYFGNSLYSPSAKHLSSIMEESVSYNIATAIPQRAAVTDMAGFMRLELLLLEFQEMINHYTEVEIPDIFDLRPLSSQRVTLKIRNIKPAQFYYVTDIDDVEE